MGCHDDAAGLTAWALDFQGGYSPLPSGGSLDKAISLRVFAPSVAMTVNNRPSDGK